MCMAAGIDPPAEIFVHGYLLMGGQKLGKTMIQSGVAGEGDEARSLKITEVSPLALADEFGVDPLRYHLLRDVPLGGDGDFSYEGIVARYNADLANNLGNLVSRVATVVALQVRRHRAGSRPGQPAGRRGGRGAAAASEAWARWAPHEALEATWRLIGAANAELEATEPWKMDPGPEVDAVLGNALEVLRIVAMLIVPGHAGHGGGDLAADRRRRGPSAARLPDDGRLGRVPGRGAGGEGGSAVPAAQGMSGWFDSHCHVQEEYLGGGERRARATATLRWCSSGRGRRGRPPRLHRHRRRHLGPGGGRGPRRCRGGDAHRAAWASIGLHPHEATAGVDEVAALLARRARRSVTASWWRSASAGWTTTTSTRRAMRNAPPSPRRSRWRTQHGLALVIHARDAWDDLFDVLEAEGVPERTVLHCFTGGPDEARPLPARRHVRLVQRHHHLQERGRRPRGRGALCPLDRLLVETDSPFLAPVPHRGRANEPALLPLVGATVAEVKGCAVERSPPERGRGRRAPLPFRVTHCVRA